MQRQKVARKSRSGESSAPEWDPSQLTRIAHVGARMVFEAAGAKISAVRLDDEGMKVPGQSLAGSRLVYVTPGHRFPLGITMSLSRRLELLEWAQKSGALIFEDNYDSEYRYSGPPLPALQGFDRNGSVIFAGSFSKVLFPSLGWDIW